MMLFGKKKKKGAWAFFFLPTPHFKPPAGDFPPARKAPTPAVEMLGLIYVGVTVFGLGSDCFAQSKSRWVTPEASVQNWRGGVVHPITHPCENVRLHDSVNPMNKTSVSHSPPLPCCWSQRRYLRGSRGPGRVEDVERVVGGKRNAVVRPSCGHLFVPVQTQLRSHRHLLLKKTHRNTREHKLLLILKKLL